MRRGLGHGENSEACLNAERVRCVRLAIHGLQNSKKEIRIS